ncbi:hypothetical protein GE09DRAFT_396062 [Coniochaeta sp. 2T2.1]|nr:hypothetical protein GE09DRAFT_396062 [Coniochaeta sp. 2T2.1]
MEVVTATSPAQPKKRTRASIACNNCRIKRSKCNAATVGTPCSQCSKQNLQCELRQDGKRQRPSSRVQVEALTDRVKMLESLLRMSNHATDSPNLAYDGTSGPEGQLNCVAPPSEESESEIPFPDGLLGLGGHDKFFDETQDHNFYLSSAIQGQYQWDLDPPAEVVQAGPGTTTSAEKQSESSGATRDSVNRRKSTAAYDRADAVSVSTGASPPDSQPSCESVHTPDSVVDHLLNLYFHQFQSMLKIVDEDAFNAAKLAQSGPAYRESLLLAMLAAGSRFSDDPVIRRRYFTRSGESVFVQRSKALLESEVRHADITTVQALVILGEMETSVGNDMSGCMYAALVSRLIFDLRLDPAATQELCLSDSEINVRHWILWGASVQDKYWAQCMERPLTIKSLDLQLSRMVSMFAKQSTGKPPTFRETIHECVLDLMEIAREAVDFIYGSYTFRATVESYAKMCRIDSKLDQWFVNLPQTVKDGPSAANNSYLFIFVIHMQLHFIRVQLRQPFAFHQPPAELSTDSRTVRLAMERIANDCRKLGTTSAIEIARLFATFRRKQDIRSLQCTGTQYATTATRFLIKHISSLPPDELVEPEAHLRSLTRTLEDMSHTFKPTLKPLKEARDALGALGPVARRFSAVSTSSVAAALHAEESAYHCSSSTMPPPQPETFFQAGGDLHELGFHAGMDGDLVAHSL